MLSPSGFIIKFGRVLYSNLKLTFELYMLRELGKKTY